VILEVLAYAGLVLAALPAVLVAHNLMLFREPPPPRPGLRPRVSLLIPARNEEANIDAAIRAGLASKGVELEVLVLDDHSTDRTSELVLERARRDPRLRLVQAPPLPAGWSGKQHACHVLAGLARHPLMVFVDADVRLAPDALARIVAFFDEYDVGLASGFPHEETGTAGEALIIPLIHVLLLGYLPIYAARRLRIPAFAAGCGQLIAVRREAYGQAGGHVAIKSSRHDGLALPRAFRRAGIATDLFDATSIARCRMYNGAREVWRGFAKNATEGMATPLALPLWTLLLGGGHVLPFGLLPIAAALGSAPTLMACALAVVCAYGVRIALALRFRQSWVGAALHPVGVAVLLALQWSALVAQLRGRPAVWRDRAYAGGRAQ
jgi:hypothetical protein